MEGADDVAALVRRLRSGRRTAQAQAAGALARLAYSAEQCDAIVAAGAIPPLLPLLQSGSAVLQKQAALVLKHLAGGSVGAGKAVAAQGGTRALVPLLSSTDAEVQQCCAAALTITAASSEEGRDAIVSAGAVAPLLQVGRNRSVAGSTALSVLCNLCATDGRKDAIAAAAGGLQALVAALHSVVCAGDGSCATELSAVRALSNLLRGRADIVAVATAAGLPASLVRLLRHGSLDETVSEVAAHAISMLTINCNAAACAAVAAAGGIAALAAQLASPGSAEALQLSVEALGDLTAHSPERCSAAVAAGCVPRLVGLVGSSGTASGEAACVLANIAASSSAGAAGVAAAGGIPVLVALLSSSTDAAALGFAAAAVHNLATRGQLGAAGTAGALRALEPLCSSPDADVRHSASKARQRVLDAANGLAVAAPEDGTPAEHRAQQRQPRVCAVPGCGATANLRRCGGCGTVRYCSEACRNAHWHAHKAECRRLQAQRAVVQGCKAA